MATAGSSADPRLLMRPSPARIRKLFQGRILFFDAHRARRKGKCEAALPGGASSVAEPGAVLGHPGLLVVRRAPLAGGDLGRPLAGPPADLDAVVGVVGDL